MNLPKNVFRFEVLLYASLMLDLPTGATIVCTFGVALIIMALLRPLIQRSRTSHQPSAV